MSAVSLGLLAGAFTTFASLPQIFYVLRMRSMKDVSLMTLCMYALGIGLWLWYGVRINAAPVIIWNFLSLCLYLAQIALKLALSDQGMSTLRRFRRRPSHFSA